MRSARPHTRRGDVGLCTCKVSKEAHSDDILSSNRQARPHTHKHKQSNARMFCSRSGTTMSHTRRARSMHGSGEARERERGLLRVRSAAWSWIVCACVCSVHPSRPITCPDAHKLAEVNSVDEVTSACTYQLGENAPGHRDRLPVPSASFQPRPNEQLNGEGT
jgi:hypothetical protein